MSRTAQFSPGKSAYQNTAAAVFGKLASNPKARRIFALAVCWPRKKQALTDKLGNYAAVGHWPAKSNREKRKPLIQAYIISPAVFAALDILMPALCNRDSEPFKLFAEAIEAQKSAAVPANRVCFAALHVAAEIAGITPAFNQFGDRALSDEDPDAAECVLPIGFSEFKTEVEDYMRKAWNREQELNSGTFYRQCGALGIRFTTDTKHGGRPRKAGRVLHNRQLKQ